MPPTQHDENVAPNAPVSQEGDDRDDRFYDAYSFSRSDPRRAVIHDRAVGIVVAQGKKSDPYYPGDYPFESLLADGAQSGTLYIVRTGLMTLQLPPIIVQSLDRCDVDLNLHCCVQVTSPADLVDEPDPKGKLVLIVQTAARYTFGRYTSQQLGNPCTDCVDVETIGQRLNEICINDFQAERGVAGVILDRLDFDTPWQVSRPPAG